MVRERLLQTVKDEIEPASEQQRRSKKGVIIYRRQVKVSWTHATKEYNIFRYVFKKVFQKTSSVK